MSATPDQVVPFLAERLHPIRPDDPEKDTSLGPIATGETLRRLRAIAVLEKINNPASRRLLERLATGLEGARETRDARAALRRTVPMSDRPGRWRPTMNSKTTRPVAVHDASRMPTSGPGADPLPRVAGGHRERAHVRQDEEQTDRKLDRRRNPEGSRIGIRGNGRAGTASPARGCYRGRGSTRRIAGIANADAGRSSPWESGRRRHSGSSPGTIPGS